MNWVEVPAFVIGAAGAVMGAKAARDLTRPYISNERRSKMVRNTDQSLPGLRMQRIYSVIADEIRRGNKTTSTNTKKALIRVASGGVLVLAAAVLRGVATG